MTTNSPDIPFGRFALPPWRENLRRLAGRLPRNGFGRRMRSLLRCAHSDKAALLWDRAISRRWIVVEVGKEAHAPVIDLGRKHGYRLHTRTKLNAILQKAGAGDETN